MKTDIQKFIDDVAEKNMVVFELATSRFKTIHELSTSLDLSPNQVRMKFKDAVAYLREHNPERLRNCFCLYEHGQKRYFCDVCQEAKKLSDEAWKEKHRSYNDMIKE